MTHLITVSMTFNNAAEVAQFFAGRTAPLPPPSSNEAAPSASAGKPKRETAKPEPAKTDEAVTITRADVSKLAVTLAAKGKREDVVAILAEFGAQAVTGSDTKPGLSDADLAPAHAKLSAVAL